MKWMDQNNKFEQAAAILSPPKPNKTTEDMPVVKTPEGVRRYNAEHWKALYLQRMEQVFRKTNEGYTLESVPGLLPYKKVKPKETVRRRITDVQGSLKSTE